MAAPQLVSLLLLLTQVLLPKTSLASIHRSFDTIPQYKAIDAAASPEMTSGWARVARSSNMPTSAHTLDGSVVGDTTLVKFKRELETQTRLGGLESSAMTSLLHRRVREAPSQSSRTFFGSGQGVAGGAGAAAGHAHGMAQGGLNHELKAGAHIGGQGGIGLFWSGLNIFGGADAGAEMSHKLSGHGMAEGEVEASGQGSGYLAGQSQGGLMFPGFLSRMGPSDNDRSEVSSRQLNTEDPIYDVKKGVYNIKRRPHHPKYIQSNAGSNSGYHGFNYGHQNIPIYSVPPYEDYQRYRMVQENPLIAFSSGNRWPYSRRYTNQRAAYYGL